MTKFTAFVLITAGTVLSVGTFSRAEFRNYEANYSPTNMFAPQKNPYPKPVWQEPKPYRQPKKLPTIQDGNWGIKDLSKQKKRNTGPKYQAMGQEQLYKNNFDPFTPDLSYPKPTNRQQSYTPPQMQRLAPQPVNDDPLAYARKTAPKVGDVQYVSPERFTLPTPQRPKPLHERLPVQQPHISGPNAAFFAPPADPLAEKRKQHQQRFTPYFRF